MAKSRLGSGHAAATQDPSHMPGLSYDHQGAHEASIIAQALLQADPEAGRRLLQRLGPDAVRDLLRAARSREPLSDQQQNEVMKRFADRLAASGAPAPTERSTERSKPHMREPHIRPVHRQSCRQSGTNQQAGLFKGADPLEGISTLFGTIDLRLLVPFLQRESASVAALALALAPRDISVQLLRQLGTESGARILLALAQTETATPAALDALREALEELREESLSHIRLGRGLVGSERVAELLSGLDVGTRNAILAKLDNSDQPEGTHASAARSLATAVRKKLVTSLQLATLATKDLALVLAQLSAKELALALLLEPDSVKEKMLCGLSSKRRAEVCEELELLGKRRGSIRKLDVEAAAEKLVAAAQELRDTGRIVFPWEEALV